MWFESLKIGKLVIIEFMIKFFCFQLSSASPLQSDEGNTI